MAGNIYMDKKLGYEGEEELILQASISDGIPSLDANAAC
jgi:hypothetical protein